MLYIPWVRFSRSSRCCKFIAVQENNSTSTKSNDEDGTMVSVQNINGISQVHHKLLDNNCLVDTNSEKGNLDMGKFQALQDVKESKGASNKEDIDRGMIFQLSDDGECAHLIGIQSDLKIQNYFTWGNNDPTVLRCLYYLPNKSERKIFCDQKER